MSAPDTQALKLSEQHLEILQHALGLDQHGRGEACRNHFCAGPADEPACAELVALGLAYVFHPRQSPLPYYNIAITDAGQKAVRKQRLYESIEGKLTLIKEYRV